MVARNQRSIETGAPSPRPATPASLRRRLAIVGAFGLVLLLGSVFAMLAMRREYQDRLVERAQFEAERALERLDPARAATLVEDCSVGQTRAGVAPSADAALLDLDAEATTRARAVLQSSSRIDVERGRRGGGAPFVIAARSQPGGSVAWATVDIQDARGVRVWKGVGISMVLAFALLLYVAVDTLRRVRTASRLLQSAARALGEDLGAPVPAPGIEELSDVAEAMRAMSAALELARKDREALISALAQEQRLGALGRVVAGIAHEVRNPLAAIKLRADLVREGDGSEGERHRDLAVLGIERLMRLDADQIPLERIG